VITELDAVLGIIEGDQPKGLVIRSTKPSGFIAGADINEFRGATDPALVQAAIGRANDVVNRLEALKAPTIAVIHGFCLGGGLEIALACKWRIAIDGAKFGFPEVMLGLHPGLGGTARSTHLIDPLQAMTLGQDTRCPESKVAWSHRRGYAGAPCPQRRQGRGFREAEESAAGFEECDPEHRSGTPICGAPDARTRRRKGASRSVAGASCVDRFMGPPWRQPRGDDGG
jgi:hypothetical protein